MSRGNIIQGQASGKLGDTVLMVRNGQQLARVYTTSGARSGKDASEAARIQRVKFGGASNQWSLYRYVCTRMFRKGRKSTQSDYNYFVKRNSALFPYLSKAENADGVHCLMPGTFSEGNLGRIELVHYASPEQTIGRYFLAVSDVNNPGPQSVEWLSSMSVLKSALISRYPTARKFTYLLSIPRETTISEEGITFVSQFVSHESVVIDLYQELTPGENEMTVIQYFSSKIQSPSLKAVIALQADYPIMTAAYIFLLYNVEGVSVDSAIDTGVLAFATDDQASDCYTTILQDTSIPTTYGAYAVWAGYRSQNSLRIAADSYGYQSGVMRDEIASVGDDLSEQMAAYVNKLKSIDENAAIEVDNLVKSGAVRAKVVRKAEVEEKEG